MLSEGRSRASGRDECGDPVETLIYLFQFCTVGNHEFEATAGTNGVIVITGKHECGIEMEVNGVGYFGYDEKGLPEGSYDSPPEIRFLVGPSLSQKLKEAAQEGAVQTGELIRRELIGSEAKRTRH